MSDQTELTPEQSAAHWKKTKGLMLTCLALWLIFGFAVHFFVDALNEIVIFGFPMGWYMGAQGSLIAFVIIVFWFSNAQNRIDTEFGVAEDEM